MTADLVIRGGIVVDGTGTDPREADVAIADGRIVEVGTIGSGARRVIDADGHVVTPGFIDGHTHYDAQVMWDPQLSPSSWHGVTTVVAGNCGFTLAPVRRGEEHLVVRNLERAEDMSPAALEAGIDWSWESFPEYLDVLDAVPKAVNVAVNIGHSALRTWAMGAEAFERSASDDDLRRMADQLRAALQAGAVGFSSSRSDEHETSDDRPVASRLASWSELEALVRVVGEQPGGMIELAQETVVRSDDATARDEWLGRLEQLAVASGVTATFGVIPVRSDGADWRAQLDVLERTNARGGRMFGQSHSRGVSTVLSFLTRLPFDHLDEWRDLRALPLDEQRRQLADPDVRARLVAITEQSDYGRVVGAGSRPPQYDRIVVFDKPLPPHSTVAEVARRRGTSPAATFVDLAVEANLNLLFVQMITQNDENVLLEIMRHPDTVMTFSDAGAHVSQIVDCSVQTHLLAYWVREAGAFTLPEAIRMITKDVAQAWSFADRGELSPGMIADINIFDPDAVQPQLPEVWHDLPAAAPRLVQRASGFLATVVGGEVAFEQGEWTGALAGRLLRRRRP